MCLFCCRCARSFVRETQDLRATKNREFAFVSNILAFVRKAHNHFVVFVSQCEVALYKVDHVAPPRLADYQSASAFYLTCWKLTVRSKWFSKLCHARILSLVRDYIRTERYYTLQILCQVTTGFSYQAPIRLKCAIQRRADSSSNHIFFEF